MLSRGSARRDLFPPFSAWAVTSPSRRAIGFRRPSPEASSIADAALWRPHSSIPIADILTIASCDGLVQQPNGIITREVKATHRHRRRIIVTRDDCIAIETDAILVLVHRSSTSFPAASFTAKATTRHKQAPRRLWRTSSQRWPLFQHRGASYFLLDLT